MRELGSKLLDVKGTCKAPQFSGRPSDWPEFKWRLDNFLTLIEQQHGVHWCENRGLREVEDVQLSVADQAKDRLLHALLVQVCSGKAATTLRNAPAARGLVAWARLLKEYEPRIPARKAAMLASLLTPGWASTMSLTEFLPRLEKWEREILQYEESMTTKFPDDLQVAVVFKFAPREVRDLLRILPGDAISDYETLKAELERIYAKSKEYGEGGVLASRGAEVDWVSKGGKGKGKGGEKGGKGSFGGHIGKGSWQKKGEGKGKGGGFVVKGKGKGKGKSKGGKASTAKGKGKGGATKGKGKGKGATAFQKGWKAQKGTGKGQGWTISSPERFIGSCYVCGKYGHSSKYCWSVHDVEEDWWPEEVEEEKQEMLFDKKTAKQEVNVIANMEDDEKVRQRYEEMFPEAPWLMVDSGSYGHVCPPDFCRDIPLQEKIIDLPIVGADGNELPFFGARKTMLETLDGVPVRVNFDVLKIRAILSVSILWDAGIYSLFGLRPGLFHIASDTWMDLFRIGKLFYLPLDVKL